MKGQKTGGRQKGTPNKVSKEIRELLSNLVYDNFELIVQDFRQMSTEQRMVLLPKILPYITPKMKQVSEEEQQERIAQQLNDYRILADRIYHWEQQCQNKNQPPATTSQLVEPANPTIENSALPDEMPELETTCPETTNSNLEMLPDNNPDPANESDDQTMQQIRHRLHYYVQDELKHRFPDMFTNSKNAPSDSTSISVPTTPPQRTPFYKALNNKRTHNKRRNKR